MLKVEHLRKVFYDREKKDFAAVKDLSFECKGGEILGLLGMNGAGKTTSLRMLSTMIKPTSGSGSLGGFDLVEQAGEVRRRIGFLSGSTGLYKKLTARETLNYFGQLNNLSKDQLKESVSSLVELLGMSDFIDRKCEKLSTGQKQKVNICRTIIHNPDVLILDEATTGLDVVAAQAIISFIRHIRDQGKAVVFSTHHMDEVEELCQRVVILHQGAVLAYGTIPEVLAQFEVKNLREIFASLPEASVV